jgi:SPP1 family phage portal protein
MLKPEEISALIQDDETSERKRIAKIGQDYYEGLHDIRNYRLYYYNADGKLIEDTTRSNIKIAHPFFTELVDQCVQYMLSGDETFVKSDIPELQDELDQYFDDDFRSELSDTLTDVCAGGFGYMYAYKNADDRTAFVFADAMGVVEVRAKDTDDHTEYVIYWYIDRIDKGKKKIKRIQVWDKQQVSYFVQVDDGKIEIDKDEPINPRPHIVYEKDNEEGRFGDSLGYIPFFRIDNNRKQTSHLKPVKALIDDYDLMACGLSNNLQDVSEALYVVKGFQGDNLEEMIQNIKTKKHIGVEPDGDVDIKTIDIPHEARVSKLDIDEKNIYRFGMGFNSAQIGDGNITNVVIKSRYALLDLKCNKLQTKLKSFLKKLTKIALTEINAVNETDYQISDVYYDFDREVMTNALDNAQIEKVEAETQQVRLTTILNAAARLDNDTVLQAICELLDLDFDDVKSLVEQNPTVDLNGASEALANAPVTDQNVPPGTEGGDG